MFDFSVVVVVFSSTDDVLEDDTVADLADAAVDAARAEEALFSFNKANRRA